MSSHHFGIAGLVLAVLLACGLYALKDQVQRVEGELRRAHAAVLAERGALDRLRTEWAMLNQPGRLARLAEAHLDLMPAHPGQIVRVTDLPFRADLALGGRSWPALLPSGGAVELRLKPYQPPARLSWPDGAAGRQAWGGR